MGVDVLIETQGSGGVTPLPAATIASASAAIFATDVGVKERERFAGLPVIESGVKRAINEPAKMVEEAVAASKNPNARKVAGTAGAAAEENTGTQLGWGKRIQQALMTGVSYMIPFVAAGGLLIALGFLLGGYDIALAPTCDALPAWASGVGADACATYGSNADLAFALGPSAGPADLARRDHVQDRRRGVRLPRAGAVGLHRLRARRTPRHRARFRRRRHLRHAGRGLPRRPGHRPPRRPRRPVDHLACVRRAGSPA